MVLIEEGTQWVSLGLWFLPHGGKVVMRGCSFQPGIDQSFIGDHTPSSEMYNG